MIYFDHKPKTGGIFIRDILRKHFNHMCVYHEVYENLQVHPGEGVEFMSGHFMFQKLKRKPYDFYFTLLRHPVHKVYSDYFFHVKKLKENRDNDKVKRSLENLKKVAQGTENTVPAILECVRCYTTEGEIVDVLREVFGEYQEPPFF